jgi:hypothetical protein
MIERFTPLGRSRRDCRSDCRSRQIQRQSLGCLAALLLAVLLNGFPQNASAQAISPYLIGQNTWMPYWWGGSIGELWDEMKTAGYQTIRIGGNQAMNDNKNLTYIIYLIDGVRAAGAEPIVQVPHDYTTQQTTNYINYINGTMGRGIKLWSVGNEPDNNDVGGAGGDVAYVGTYMRTIGSALKLVDTNAIVMGPDTAGYSSSWFTALLGGSADVTGIDVNGNYPIDIITWHSYNFNTSSGFEANVNDMLSRLATRNALRPANKQLGWGFTEFNTHWDMNLVSTNNPTQYTWSFHAGQLFAEIYDVGMRKGGYTLCAWAMHEHGGDRSGTDLSLFDSPAEGFPGRSTYWHSLMLGQNMRSNYLAHTDNQSNVKIISMGDARGPAVMILNESTNTAYDYALKLNLATPSTRTLQIQVDAGLNVEYLGTMPAYATRMLVFNAAGGVIKQYDYNSAQSDARVGPDISSGLDDTLLLHYQMGQALPQIQDATNTASGSALTAGAGFNVFEVNANTTPNYASAPVLQVNFKVAGTNLTAALAQTNWFTFQLTVGTNVADLDLTQLSFNAARGGSGTPRGYAVYVTTPTTTNQLIQPATDVATQRASWSGQQIDLTGVSSLQNLKAGQKVTFTIPAYSPATTSSLEFDDIKVRGFVANQITITSVSPPNPKVGLSWTSTPGKFYSVDYSLDLKNWATLVTNLPAATNATETATQLDLSGHVLDAVLLQYQMGAATTQVQNAQTTAAGGALTKGAGLSLFDTNGNPTSASGSYGSAPVLQVNFNAAQTSLSAALAASAWFTFTLTVGSAVGDLDLTALTFNVAKGGTSTPRGYAVYVTTPTTSFAPVQSATDVTATRPDWGSLQTINLSATAGLQNLTAGQVVTFCVPVYSPATGSSLEFDDITVRGNLSPLTPPAYGTTNRLFLRVRSP